MSNLIAVILLFLETLASIYLILTRRSQKTTTTNTKNNYSSLPTTSTSAAATKVLIHIDIEIDPDSFYPRLRIQKALTILTFIFLEIGLLFEISFNSFNGSKFEEIKSLLIGDGLMLMFWAVLLVISIKSFFLSNSVQDINRHWSYTVTSAVLTLLALFSTLLRLVLPSPESSLPVAATSTLTLALTIYKTIFQIIAFVLVGTTNRCAPLGKYEGPSSSSLTNSLRPISALTSCSPISYVLFDWIGPVLAVGSAVESLSEFDLPMLGRNDRADTSWEKIKVSNSKGAPGCFNLLLWRVVKVNKNLFIWQIGLALVNSGLYYLPAFFLQQLVAFLEVIPEQKAGESRNLIWGYAFCLGLLFSAVFEACISGALWFVSNTMLATRIRTQLNCLVFDKTLKRQDVTGVSSTKPDSTPETDSESNEEEVKKGIFDSSQDDSFGSKSQVLNLFTIDVDRVADFAIWSFSVIDAPAEIVIGTYFLYNLLGYAAFVGISVAVLFLPLNHYTSTAFASVQDKLMTARDKRVGLLNEVLQSVRMIKYMAYEKSFEDRILVARTEELKHLKRNFLLEVTFNAIWSASPILCVLVSFYVFTGPMGKELTPSIAFASLAVWNELRFALNVIPDTLVQAIQCLISLRRIEKYLDSPEIKVAPGQAELAEMEEIDETVAFVNATCTWPTTPDPEKNKVPVSIGTRTPRGGFQLQDISLNFPIGQLSLVCGSLGSGKTLLLLSLLGETETLAGQIVCPRSPPDAITLPNIEWDALITEENWIQKNRSAFVPQSAFLQNATIRTNILFGLPYREERYKRTLEVCSLITDLDILEDGDSTEIGEKGINLSGGQKARVSLARAVYSRASLVLLDDVLSAVDAHTALHIFNNCLKGSLMKGRTIILVSHHVQLCAAGSDYIVSLENGRVKFEGSSRLFMESDRFRVLDEEEEAIETIPLKNAPKAKNKVLVAIATESAPPSESSASEGEDSDSEEELEKPEKVAKKLIEEESRAVGRVNWSVWSLYLGLSGGSFFWIAFAIAFFGTKLADVAQSLWLSKWSGSYSTSVDGQVPHSVNYYLSLYAILSFVGVIVSTSQWFVLYTGSLRASDRLFKIILHNVLRAPLRFFDTIALGRLLNRFGKDFEGVDSNLPDHYGRSIIYGLGVLTTLTVVASVAPTFLIGFALLSVAYYHHAKLFSKTARELRRLDSVSKSPLYSVYGEAVAGVTIIRSFGASQSYMDLMLTRCSTNVSYYWYLWSVNRWLSIRFSLLSAVVLGLTGVVLLRAGDKVSASLAGFALTFSLNIANDILFLVRRYTNLELAMVAVERIKEYSEVEQEAAEIIIPRPPAHWPSLGEIHIEKLSIRYAPDLPNVLHDLSFTIAAGSKVGIVGPTGCGKSTLALSFFRFVEAHSGKIIIDGIDIAKIGLLDLRTNLTIIPQDPTILSGTLRSTLDIFNNFEDIEIFDALRRVHLLPPVNEVQEVEEEEGVNVSPFTNLDGEVSEGGGNFSQGQRQLLCMARALLKRNRILLLDEATASVDYETDELISATIRQEFIDSTLLVIAHRIRTVIDFDKILVLDAGRIVEYDHPATLLANPASKFYALCRASGKAEFKILKKMAQGRTKVIPAKPSSSKLVSKGSKNLSTTPK